MTKMEKRRSLILMMRRTKMMMNNLTETHKKKCLALMDRILLTLVS